MKLVFGDKELPVLRAFDTVSAGGEETGKVRRVDVTLDGNQQSTDEISTLLEEGYEGEFTIDKDDGSSEVFIGFCVDTVTKNIEKKAEQTMISFKK